MAALMRRRRWYAGILGGALGVAVVVLPVWMRRESPRAQPTSPSRSQADGRGDLTRAATGLRAPRLSTELDLRLRPGHPTYNPSRLLAILKADRIFDAEPRDDHWAAPIEAKIGALIEDDLKRLTNVSKVTMSCRTTGCKISWEGGAPSERLTVHSVLTTLYGGACGGSTDPNTLVVFYYAKQGSFLSGVSTADPAELIAALLRQRNETVARERSAPRLGIETRGALSRLTLKEPP